VEPVGVEMMRPSPTAWVRLRVERVMVRRVRCGEAPRWRITSFRAWRGREGEFWGGEGGRATRRRLRRRMREERVGPREAPRVGSQVGVFADGEVGVGEERMAERGVEPDM